MDLSRLFATAGEVIQGGRLWELLAALMRESGGGSSVRWGNVYVVDNELGNNDTARPNDLQLKYETPQAAVDAAAAALLDGATLASILYLPGTFDLGAGQIVWPNVGGIHFIALDPVNTVITNDGTQPLIIGAPTVDGFTGSVSNMRLVTSQTGYAIVLNRTGATDVLATSFTFENVGFTGARALSKFTSLLDRGSYVVDPSKAAQTILANVDLIRIDRAALAPGEISVEHAGESIVAILDTVALALRVGSVTPTAARVYVVGACRLNTTELSLTDGFEVEATGTLGDIEMTLAEEGGQYIAISGSAWSSLAITGNGVGDPFAVRAVGCSAREANAVVAVHNNIKLDLRGCSSPLGITGTGGATVDRDSFGSHAYAAGAGAASGTHTFAPPLPPEVIVTDYEVVVETDFEVSWWITGKSDTGYTVNWGASSAGGTVYTTCIRRDSAAG